MLKHRMRVILFFILIALMFTACIAQASNTQDSTVRVYLRRLKITDSVHIVTQGTYMLEDGSVLFSPNTEMSISLRDGQLILHTGGTAIRLGSRIKLLRCSTGESAGLMLNGAGLYEGDLLLSVNDNVIMPVLDIHVEDYLLGVVPFEMGDSFPLEALKAQAIAARTYALRKRGAEQHYDVEDTTNDQAYRGRTTYSPLSEQAVNETEGLVGVYKDHLAQCY